MIAAATTREGNIVTNEIDSKVKFVVAMHYVGAPLPLSLTAEVVCLIEAIVECGTQTQNQWNNEVVVSCRSARKHNHGNSAPSRKCSCYFAFCMNVNKAKMEDCGMGQRGHKERSNALPD